MAPELVCDLTLLVGNGIGLAFGALCWTLVFWEHPRKARWIDEFGVGLCFLGAPFIVIGGFLFFMTLATFIGAEGGCIVGPDPAVNMQLAVNAWIAIALVAALTWLFWSRRLEH